MRRGLAFILIFALALGFAVLASAARELCSRFKMMFYVTALKFKDGTVCSSDHSLTVPKSIECRRRYFLLAFPQALGGLCRILNQNILYSAVVIFLEGLNYNIKPAGNQDFPAGFV